MFEKVSLIKALFYLVEELIRYRNYLKNPVCFETIFRPDLSHIVKA